MTEKITRLTVNATQIVPIDPGAPDCGHEVTWFTKVDWVERCAICGEYLGLWKGRPKT